MGSTSQKTLSGPGRWTRLYGVEPADGLGHRPVEVVDERQDPRLQLLGRTEAGAAEQLPHQDAEPDLDLIEPRGVLGRVDEPDSVARIGEEGRPALPRLQHPALSFLAQILLNPTALSHPPHQALRLMR